MAARQVEHDVLGLLVEKSRLQSVLQRKPGYLYPEFQLLHALAQRLRDLDEPRSVDRLARCIVDRIPLAFSQRQRPRHRYAGLDDEELLGWRPELGQPQWVYNLRDLADALVPCCHRYRWVLQLDRDRTRVLREQQQLPVHVVPG